MRKLIILLLIINASTGLQTICQSVYINELAAAKKLPPSPQKDSLIVSILYQLSHVPSKNMLLWRDSLEIFSNKHNNTIGLLISKFIKSDSVINKNELVSTAIQLEKLKAYSNASLFYARAGAAYTYYFIGTKEQMNALNYYNKALKLAKLSKSNQDINRIYDYIGEHYFFAKDYQKSIKYLKITEKLVNEFKIKSLLPTVYTFMASDYLSLNQIETAEKYYNLATEKLEDTSCNFDLSYKVYIKNVYISHASRFFLQAKQYKKALEWCAKGLNIIELYENKSSIKNKFENNETEFLETMHKSYFELGDFENAYNYYNKLENLKNLKGENSLQFKFNNLNEKFLGETNKLKITALENDNLKKESERQSIYWYFGLGIISLLLFTIGFVFYSNNKLKEKNIELIEKNKQITEAHLKGQTTERQRVAIDLHDNLGSTISSIKYSLEAIDRSKMNADEVAVQENLYSLLDKAYNDVRLLSHNLLPEEFEKKGLTETLTEFVRKINKASKIKFELNIAENFGRHDHKIEFELYSICMELVNNIMKHSKATMAKITLSKQTPPLGAGGLMAEQILLLVSDNGIGIFKNDSDGKGMKNVQTRVDSINGKWIVKAVENQGVVNEILV